MASTLRSSCAGTLLAKLALPQKPGADLNDDVALPTCNTETVPAVSRMQLWYTPGWAALGL